jgi:signal transduction histidine kinase
VTDNGIGLDFTKLNVTGMGLNIMNYRARIIGAQFELHPGQDSGLSIRCLYIPPPKTSVSAKGSHGSQEP